ncbi:MAG: tryptophan 2,3-dioxygenase [Bdellovibrionaceae bacterium]|nr:tryptophan 2,3-dioxygenase [Pseudobdellovibrionaceae bacterium]
MKYEPIHYHDYLGLDKLLNSQKRRSETFGKPAHEEWLFISVHQVYEIWFFQILKEIQSLVPLFNKPSIPERDMGTIAHRIDRIYAICKSLTGPLDILETMTPHEFLDFRDYLYPASGFQSGQFRMIEVLLGLKIENRIKLTESPFYDHLREPQKSELLQLMQGITLYDGLENWLSRTPFLKTSHFDFGSEYKKALLNVYQDDLNVIKNNPRLTESDKERSSKNIQAFLDQVESVFDETKYNQLKEQGVFRLNFKAFHAALFISLYRDEPVLQTPFSILNALMDIDEALTTWRYRHALMAHRMLGRKIGTGGSSGTDYLKETAEKHKIYNDLFNMSSFLIPRSKLPPYAIP